jgi:hypothetical protein
VDDRVSADVIQPVVLNGRDVVPVGATVSGMVSEAEDAVRAEGKALITITLTSLNAVGRQYTMQTSGFSATAAARTQDAGATGHGSGLGLQLADASGEVRLESGAEIWTRLTAPVVIGVAD